MPLSTSTRVPPTQGKTDPSPGTVAFIRPFFNSHKTSDRLREGSEMRSSPILITKKIRKGRRSVFKEIGLEDECSAAASLVSSNSEQVPAKDNDEVIFGRTTGLPGRHGFEPEKSQGRGPGQAQAQEQEQRSQSRNGRPSTERARLHRRPGSLSSRTWFPKLSNGKGRPRVLSASEAPPGSSSGLTRFALIAMLIAVVIPAFGFHGSRSRTEISGADAGPVVRKDSKPRDVCVRWAHQAAVVNGTLYIYGGEAKTEGDQDTDTWNNDFMSLDLSKGWDTDSPALTSLSTSGDPPAVALGYLWHDYNNLYLYGGQFADNPYVEPGPESLWQYSINDKAWNEFPNPKTSEGNYSEPADEPVHRAAEGAGISVPELGMSWYFGGHLDWATTPGWSKHIDRVYLQSLLEFTHPGYINSGVKELSDDTGAGKQGAFRNITRGGVQANEFPERADGSLVFVPGWGEMGVLIGLAGGTNDTFVRDLDVLDVYDIANSKWFHQDTSGDTPTVRVNPCAVVAGASDGSSFQIYMFGGQNLVPFSEQVQYDDMYILTIPSFTWIKVDSSDDNKPSSRAGHTCSMWDGQMVVFGGYIGNGDECDSQSVYVFDASSLKWRDKFEARDAGADSDNDNVVLSGSNGYRVPEVVQKVVGGDEDGSATASLPASSATGGPFATGKPPTFTATVTNYGPGATGQSDSDSSDDSDDGDGEPSPGLIAAGVIAGIAGALALYLGFCAWLYRRQVRAYRQHLAVANRYSAASPGPAGFFGTATRGRSRHKRDVSQASGDSFGWVGINREEPQWLTEPKFISSSDDASPGTGTLSGTLSGTVSGSGSGAGLPRQSEEVDQTPHIGGSAGAGGSTENLLEGQEPSFFSVVMGPRRALRVVNGIDD